jgi:hypothetical protein
MSACYSAAQPASAIGAGVTSAVVSAGILVAGFLPYTTYLEKQMQLACDTKIVEGIPFQ